MKYEEEGYDPKDLELDEEMKTSFCFNCSKWNGPKYQYWWNCPYYVPSAVGECANKSVKED